MNCREIQDLLTPYLLGDLEPAQAAAVREHLQACAPCRDNVEDLQATLQLLRESLAETPSVPQRLPEKFTLQFKMRRWRRPRLARPQPAPRRWWVSIPKYAAVAAVFLILAGLLLPNLGDVREKARRVNDLSNLNAVWKSASDWGLNPADSFRPNFPSSLDQLVKEAKIAPEMLVNYETGKPVEYYPGAAGTDGDRPILVSRGKKGMNVVKAAGQGMWIDYGTPEAIALTRQLAGLPKQVASVPQQIMAKGPSSLSMNYWKNDSAMISEVRKDSRDESYQVGALESSAQLQLRAPPPPQLPAGSVSGGGTSVSVEEYTRDGNGREGLRGRSAPADALKLAETESAERKEKSSGQLDEIAARRTTEKSAARAKHLTADYAAVTPSAPMQKKAISAKSAEATKNEEVAIKSTVDAAITAPARQLSASRLKISATTSFLHPSVPVAAPAMAAIDDKVGTDMGAKISDAETKRLMGVRDFQKGWAVSGGTASGSGGGGAAGGYAHGSGKAVLAKFALFQAKYQDGDWNCNPDALNNLLLQINAWSKNRIDAKLQSEALDIGSDRLFTTQPPFLYLTGSKGINLRDNEVRNIRDYLMLGGALWVDSARPGKGTQFDLSVRREMKRIMPDRDFEIVPKDHKMFDSFFDNIGLPPGLDNSHLPVEQMTIGGKAAILYTLNGYGTLLNYPLLTDGKIDWTTYRARQPESRPLAPDAGITDALVRDAYKFGVNNVVHLLTRYQRDYMLLPKTLPSSSNAPAGRDAATTNAVPAPEPAASNVPPVAAPITRATGVNPFVSAAAKPFSTFSIDVDTASYALSRNYLLRGQLPPPEAVRTEEFVNYFDYDYAPPGGPTFAVHADCGPSAFGRGLALLKIGVKGRRLGREEKRAAVLTLLIDTSGSMATPDRIELIKSALSRMVERLDPADKVAIVQYDSHARLLLEHTPAADKKRILAVIEGLQTSGSTALEEGMREAYATAARGFNSAAGNRVLLLSDGMANLGTMAAEDILASVAGYRKQGITLSVFGFGLGAYNDVMLETLANKGDGVYAFIDSPSEAERVLVDDLAATVNLIARDVKIQVEFNPQRVKRYRQLGYENRQLQKEQFRDDSVDAGEIGSGQSVTALYELELQGDHRQPLGMVRVRCRNALTGQIEEIEQPIAPASGTTPFEAMDVRFRLAAAAAEFSEILRGSPFAAGSNFEDVARVLRPVALELNLDNRIHEFLRMTQTGLTPKFQEAENP